MPLVGSCISFLVSLGSARVLSLEEELQLQQQQNKRSSEDTQAHIDSLLRDAGALEHRLVSTQQERDEVLASLSSFEQERQEQRLPLEGNEEAEKSRAVRAAEKTRDEALAENAELKSLVGRLQHTEEAVSHQERREEADRHQRLVDELAEQCAKEEEARRQSDRARQELDVARQLSERLLTEKGELQNRVDGFVCREEEALKAREEGDQLASSRRMEDEGSARQLDPTLGAEEDHAALQNERDLYREERDELERQLEQRERELGGVKMNMHKVEVEMERSEQQRRKKDNEEAAAKHERERATAAAMKEEKEKVAKLREDLKGMAERLSDAHDMTAAVVEDGETKSATYKVPLF